MKAPKTGAGWGDVTFKAGTCEDCGRPVHLLAWGAASNGWICHDCYASAIEYSTRHGIVRRCENDDPEHPGMARAGVAMCSAVVDEDAETCPACGGPGPRVMPDPDPGVPLQDLSRPGYKAPEPTETPPTCAAETPHGTCLLLEGHDGAHDDCHDDYLDAEEAPEDRDPDGRTPAERAALDRWARRNDDGAGLPDDDADPDGDFLRPE